MIRALLWKEWRESRAALIAGAVWLGAGVVVWGAARLDWPDALCIVPGITLALAPIATLALLSSWRIGREVHRGTWDFLLTRPVRIPSVVLAKWSVALGLGLVITALFLGTLRLLIGPMPEAWITFLWLALATQALLHLTDSVNWGPWIGLRVALTTAVFIALWIGFVTDGFDEFVRSLTVPLCLAAGFALVLRLRMEPCLPDVSGIAESSGRGPAEHRSPIRAWRWAMWRETRLVWLTILAIPFAILVAVLARTERPLDVEFVFVIHLYTLLIAFPLAGAALGCLGTVRESITGTREFARTLPLAPARAQQSRLLLAIGQMLALLAITALPLLLWLNGILEDAAAARELGPLLGRAVFVALCLVPVAFTLVCAAPRVGGVIAGVVVIWLLSGHHTFRIDEGFLFGDPVWVTLAILAVASWWLAPWLDWRREV